MKTKKKEFGKNLYKIWQDHNNDYDTYDSAIVCADSEEEAKNTDLGTIGEYGSWVEPKFVYVEFIGIAKEGMEKGIIIDSFNAG